MEKQFDPHTIEQKWYDFWESERCFDPQGQGKSFCIMLPPPNVTGSLHMGHGFQQTLMDILIRYHRMSGDNTLWQPGTDHAGIATQMVVERQLIEQGITRHDIGREKFIDKVWQWKQQSGGAIGKQMRRLGASAFWDNECFTMDASLSAAVNKVFIDLYDEGLIYRGKRLVNWDPALLTAISDLEVEQIEEEGHLWHIRYSLTDASGEITIATTRPETLLGDVAVAVHPDDTRYQHLIGKHLHLPIADRHIPIIADQYVDPEFGSGCVKITPAHDFNDYAIGQRHNLPIINIFHPNATLNENVPERYRELDRFVARKKILEELTAADRLVKTEKHHLTIPRGDRSGQVIEPYLTDQWFVKIDTLAKPALNAVKNGEITFHPETWTKTYYQWMENIEDWCISRQLWWGHRIPAWYDSENTIYVGNSEAEVRTKYQLSDDVQLTQDQDVLDTWFSSALWPFSSLGWPTQTKLLDTHYPSSVLISGFDIIFFWIARMIMFGIKFQQQIPFKDIYITGLIRDSDGQKMSKTKGNVIDPIDIIDGIDLPTLVKKRTTGLMQPQKAAAIKIATEKQFPKGIPSYGTDALRFTYCALASFSRDLRFDMARMESHRNFCNKLWNAARFVLMNTENQEIIQPDDADYSIIDRWIMSRLQTTIASTKQHLENYRFDLLAKTCYEFVWNEYCDWYLELTKPLLNSDTTTSAQKNATYYCLINVLEITLRLMHPIMPFITEEIWQQVKLKMNIHAETIMNQPFPQVIDTQYNIAVEEEVNWLKQIIVGIRSIRSEMNVSPGKKISIKFQHGSADDKVRLDNHQSFLTALAKIASIEWLAAEDNPPASATHVVGDLHILIPLAGLIDKDAELSRLTKAINKIEKELIAVEAKLNNEKFISRAPENLVEKAKSQQQELQAQQAVLSEKLEQLNAM